MFFYSSPFPSSWGTELVIPILRGIASMVSDSYYINFTDIASRRERDRPINEGAYQAATSSFVMLALLWLDENWVINLGLAASPVRNVSFDSFLSVVPRAPPKNKILIGLHTSSLLLHPMLSLIMLSQLQSIFIYSFWRAKLSNELEKLSRVKPHPLFSIRYFLICWGMAFSLDDSGPLLLCFHLFSSSSFEGCSLFLLFVAKFQPIPRSLSKKNQ